MESKIHTGQISPIGTLYTALQQILKLRGLQLVGGLGYHYSFGVSWTEKE